MKSIVLTFLFVVFSTTIFGQYFQNFDNLSYGDYIGVQDTCWTTWSNNPGSSEDAQVDTLQSKSNPNSIYFMSTSSTGGPQDAVLEFGNAYNTGNFVFETAMYVESGKGAYFNFQAEQAIGTTWAMDFHFIQDSMMHVVDQSNVYFAVPYPANTWFDLKIDINLNTNVWDVYIDTVLQGSIQNTVNQIASLDVFPLCQSTYGGNGQSKFWLDNVGFSHTPYTLPTLNCGIYRVELEQAAITGVNNPPVIQIRNLGSTPITSFDLEVTYNNNAITKSITGVSIASLDTYEVSFSQGLLIDQNATTVTASLTSVNGNSSDDDGSDDSKSIEIHPLVPASGKLVIVEEATGTWCGWCPRGTVAMDFLARDYHGFAQGIAVHNSDPMENAVYDNGIGTLISGYPSALVDRGTDLDPSNIFSYVEEAMVVPPTALMLNGAEYDGSSLELNVSITTDFIGSASSAWKIACVLTEDSVTGTSSGYSQSNYYSGGGNGSLVGVDGVDWAALPSSVPASQMVYNHVGRLISPSFSGFIHAFPTGVDSGDSHVFNFTFTLDAEWDTANMHIIGMLLDPTGSVNNGSASSITEAIEEGFETGVDVTGIEVLGGPDIALKMYPNPSNVGYTNLDFNSENQEVKVEVKDISGRLLYVENYGKMNGKKSIKLNTSGWKKGTYLVELMLDESIISRQLIVN